MNSSALTNTDVLTDLRVDEERQHQHCQQQVGHRQADDEVVRGSFQGALGEHTQTHQDVPQDDDQDKGDTEDQGQVVVRLTWRAARCHIVHDGGPEHSCWAALNIWTRSVQCQDIHGVS